MFDSCRLQETETWTDELRALLNTSYDPMRCVLMYYRQMSSQISLYCELCLTVDGEFEKREVHAKTTIIRSLEMTRFSPLIKIYFEQIAHFRNPVVDFNFLNIENLLRYVSQTSLQPFETILNSFLSSILKYPLNYLNDISN